MLRWHTLAAYYYRTCGARGQKIPLDAGASCPNRDGTLSRAGCLFCNAQGSGSGLAGQGLSLRGQWQALCAQRLRQAPQTRFLAYLQSFSNTYGPKERLQQLLQTASALPGCWGLAVGTRPDCLDSEKLDMDKAVASKVVDPATRKNFALNDLVLIVPAGSKKPAKLEDIKALKRVAIGNPDSVPAGRYAKAALVSAKLWEGLQPQLILGNSVRQVLDYVARGEVDAGFVYRTDAKQLSGKVDVVMVVGGHDPVSYPIAVATTGKNPKMGQEFLNFVLSPEGQAVLAKYGFSKPE